MKSIRRLALVIATVLAVFGTKANADYVSPIGLAPGTQYQLIFVTADTTAATSTNINYYNSFVRAEAALDPSLPQGVTWNAIVSTPTVNAITNAPAYDVQLLWTDGYGASNNGVGGPIANQQLYPGGGTGEEPEALLSELTRYDQYGSFVSAPAGESSQEAMGLNPSEPPNSAPNYGTPDPGAYVFTGTNGSGVANYPAGGDGTPAMTGRKPVDDPGYVAYIAYAGPGENPWDEPPTSEGLGVEADTESLHLYALSSIITVPSPEPTTFSLLCAACLVLGGHSFLRWRRAARLRWLNGA